LTDFITLEIINHVMPQIVTADGLEAHLTTAMAVNKKNLSKKLKPSLEEFMI
jgi:hypothetical protein